jgi:cytochrome b561
MLLWWLVFLEDVNAATSPAQVQQAAANFAKEHLGIFAVFVFLNAFVVAATSGRNVQILWILDGRNTGSIGF